jgi:hypothetical protein
VTEKLTDGALLAQIETLVQEEEALYGHGAPSDADRERLKALNVSLDRCWDLLRQRRALREFGRDPDDAELRPAAIVEKYEG